MDKMFAITLMTGMFVTFMSGIFETCIIINAYINGVKNLHIYIDNFFWLGVSIFFFFSICYPLIKSRKENV